MSRRRDGSRGARADLLRVAVIWLGLVAFVAWQLLAPPADSGTPTGMLQNGIRTAFPWVLPVAIALVIGGAIFLWWGWRRLHADPDR